MVEELEQIDQVEQQDPPTKKRALYDAVSKKYNLGTYDEFETKLKDPAKRKALYDHVGNEFELGTYQEFETKISEPVKKKVGSVIVGNSYGASDSEAQSSSNEIPTVELYNTSNGEQVEADPISLSKKYGELKDRKKTIATNDGSSFGMGTSGGVHVVDEDAQKAAQQIKKDLGDINPDQLNNELRGLGEEELRLHGKELLEDRKNNPQVYQRKVARLKWEPALDNELNKAFESGRLDEQGLVNIKSSIASSLQNSNVGDYKQQRENINSVANAIKEFGGENKDELLKNYAVEVSKVYGNSYNSGFDKAIADSPEGKYLDSDEQLGLHYLKDLAPEKAAQYDRLQVDPKTLKDDPYALKAVNHLKQTLAETGIGLQENSVREELNNIYRTDVGDGVTLSPEQQIKAKELTKKLEELTAKKKELDHKYPDRINDKVDDAMQEILGQDLGYGYYAAGSAGKAFKNTAQGIWVAVSAPFMSDASNRMRELSIMGETLDENKVYHKTDANKSLVTDTLVIEPELQSQIDKIKNDKSLGEEDKRTQLYTLLKDNSDKFGRVPVQGGKFNISPSSIIYGVTDLGTTLLPFVTLEAATGGVGGSGAAAKFLRTFTAAAATSFHDEYANAIMEGKPESEAYKQAMGITAINSFAMAGAGAPDAIRSMAGLKTSAGKIISRMSDAEIEKVLKEGGSKALNNFKGRIKEIPGQFKEGLKSGAKFEAAMAGAAEAKHQLYNTEIDREQNFKQALLNTAISFPLMSVALGQAGYKSPSNLQKSGLLEFGKSPESFIAHLDEMKKSGEVTPAEYDQKKSLIEKSAESYKSLPQTNAKGKPLSENEKGNYLYNNVIKNDAYKSASTLPPKQAAKAEHTAMVADHANDLILEPRPTDKLEARLRQIEKELTPEKKDDGTVVPINEKLKKDLLAEKEAIDNVIEHRGKFDKAVKLESKDLQSGEVNVDEIKIPAYKEVFKNGTPEEKQEALKDISDQWHDEGTREATENNFGKSLVDKAVKDFPQETQKSLLNESQTNDVQQSSEAESNTNKEVPETGRAASEGEGTVPPTEEVGGASVYTEPKRTVFSHRGLQEVATEFELNDITPRERVTDLELFRGADETISKWEKEGSYKKNVDGLIEKAKAGEIFSPEQNVIMAQHIANVREQTARIREKYGMDSPEYNKALQDFQNITTIGQKVRSDIGAALRVPNLSRTYLPSLDDAMAAKMEAKKVDTLTDAEKTETTKEFEEIKAARDKAEQVAKEATAKFEEMKAKNELLRKQLEAKGKKTGKVYNNGKRDFNAEIKNYKDELIEAKEEHTKWLKDNGIHTSSVGGNKLVLTNKMAKIILKIASVHVEQVGVKVAEVAKRTWNEVKDIFEGITEEDIREVFSGKYNEKKLTKNEITAQMRQLQSESKLLIEYDNLINGGEPKNEARKQKRNERLAAIRKQIDGINKERGTGKYSETEIAKRLIEANKKKQEEFKRKVREGDFEKKKQPTSVYDSPQFKSENPELYKKLLDSQNAAHEAQIEFERKLNEEDMKGWGWAEKIRSGVKKTSGTLKHLFASFDASAIAVQNLPLIAKNPIIGAQGIWHSFKEFKSQKEFDRYLTELHNSPDWYMIKDSGLRVTEPKSLLDSGREDFFPERFKAVVKIKGKTYGYVKLGNGKYELLDITKPFERQFTSLGNWLRVVSFRTEAEKLYEAGLTYEKNPEEFKTLAKRLNNLSSSSDIPTAYQNEITKTFIWSTRLVAAKLNMLGISDIAAVLPGTGVKKGYYKGLGIKGQKISRQQALAAADLGKFAVSVMAWTYLYSLATGGKINGNPDSNGFLDVEYGDGKSMNFTGGFSRYMSLLTQLYKGGRRDKSGVFNEYENKGTDRLKEVAGFVRGKAPPLTSSTLNIVAGKNMANQETDAATEASKYKMPLAMGQIKAQIDKDGYSALFKEGLLTFVGFNSKDQRDYIDQDITIPEIKYMADKGVRIVPYKKDSLMPLTNDGKPIEVTDEKYDEFVKKREEYIKKDVRDLMDGKKHILEGAETVEDENEQQQDKPKWSILTKGKVDKITSDELKGFVMTATTRANEKAIHDVFKGRGNAPKDSGKRKIE